MLYLLIVYSFNNQLRFNRKGEFNLPVGKRDFNSKMQGKLEAFIDLLEGYEILELARTGITGLSRGVDDVFYLEEDGEDY